MPRGLLYLIVLVLLGTSLRADDKTPTKDGVRIPNNSEQTKVEKALREKYKAEFASNDASARGTLAHKFRDEADTTAVPSGTRP